MTKDYYKIQLVDTQKINYKKIRNITLLIIYAIFAFYFLINGPGIFKEWDSSWTITTIIYMVGVSIFLSIQEKIPRNLEKPLTESSIGFIVAFILATVLFIILRDANLYFTNVTAMPLDKIPATLVYQLIIVAASEEIIFRGILLEIFHQIHWLIAVIVTSVLFALFHYAVYGGSLVAMMMAFGLGMIFALCVYRWNIGVSVGLHFAWNSYVFGATALL